MSLLIVLVLAAIAAAVWLTWQKQQASLHWPSVPGQIVSARIEQSDDGSTNGESSRRFNVRLEYAYSVAGVAYRGTRIRLVSDGHVRAADAEVELLRYSPGAQVEVFYDPLRPAESVLQPG